MLTEFNDPELLEIVSMIEAGRPINAQTNLKYLNYKTEQELRETFGQKDTGVAIPTDLNEVPNDLREDVDASDVNHVQIPPVK